jgi:hypothetical protein
MKYNKYGDVVVDTDAPVMMNYEDGFDFNPLNKSVTTRNLALQAGDEDIDFSLPRALRQRAKNERETGGEAVKFIYGGGSTAQKKVQARIGAHAAGKNVAWEKSPKNKGSYFASDEKRMGKILASGKKARNRTELNRARAAGKTTMEQYLDIRDFDVPIITSKGIQIVSAIDLMPKISRKGKRARQTMSAY